jgi:hypothetical protein
MVPSAMWRTESIGALGRENSVPRGSDTRMVRGTGGDGV